MDLVPMNGIGWPSSTSCGSTTLPEEPPDGEAVALWHLSSHAGPEQPLVGSVEEILA